MATTGKRHVLWSVSQVHAAVLPEPLVTFAVIPPPMWIGNPGLAPAADLTPSATLAPEGG